MPKKSENTEQTEQEEQLEQENTKSKGRQNLTTGKRTWVLVDENNKPLGHHFSGKTPRQAAWKAANKNLMDSNGKIRLRQRNRIYPDRKTRLHVFKGSRKEIEVTEDMNLPEWLSSQKTIWHAIVSKVEIEVV